MTRRRTDAVPPRVLRIASWALAAAGVLGSCGEPTPSVADRTGVETVVERVVDGDTLIAPLEGRSERIRLIGIDTPEAVAPDRPVECFGPEASRYARERLEGRRVRLEFDVDLLDRFGRTLAYVWLGDELVNETLVAEGYAVVTTFPPNVRYVERFTDAQRRAREGGLGLWEACG
jgi:micrococcal nuclease